MPVKRLKGQRFLLRGEPKSYQAIKSGRSLYIYVQDDGLLSFAALFDKIPTNEIYRQTLDHFKKGARYTYEVINPHPYLMGSRINPAFLEVTRIQERGDDLEVGGVLHNVWDTRLPYLDRSESTEFGPGTFNLESIIALYDGSFFNIALSPSAEEIAAIVDEQKEAFKSGSSTAPLQALLKPHAYEVYKVENDLVYFVTKAGRWECINLVGNRKLDMWDRERIHEYAVKHRLYDNPNAARQAKEDFYKKPMRERFTLKDLAPLFLDEVAALRAKDQAAIAKTIEHSSAARPSDGLETIAGLKEGTAFLPTQAYTLAKMQHRDRLPIDIDPGGGKTLLIIADTLRQIEQKKSRRPLVIVPNDLVSQFALEVRSFSDLNPWVITSETLRKWSKGDFNHMLTSAAQAPANTLFITSYHFLAEAKEQVNTGRIVKGDYQTTEVYTTPYRLINELGIDSVFIDEAHSLKSNSTHTKAVSTFAKLPRLKAFTGTIMPGNLVDVLGMMGVVHSSVFGSAGDFLEDYSPSKTINSYKKEAPKEIRAKLKRFGMPSIRQTAWGTMMPRLHRKYHFVKFNTTQQRFYEGLLNNSVEEIEKDPKLSKMLKKFNARLEEQDEDAKMSPSLLARFSPLDVFLNSPAEAASYLNANLTGDDRFSPKMVEINKICSEHLSTAGNGKVLIFVQHKEAAKNILDQLDAGVKPHAEYYEGGMVDVLSRFRNPDSDLKVLVGVDKTLRLGHNLQVANCIIHADTLWLPGDMRQREARAHRVKQQRDVFVHHIVTQDSHEMLKNARLLSAQHTISKANSDFEDEEMLPHMEMTLEGMRTFREIEKLDPLMMRQQKLDEFAEKQTEVEKEFYGTRVMQPATYTPGTGKKLAVVPSTDVFEGNLRDANYIIEDELSEMRWHADAPKLLSFHYQYWDEQWFITSFKAADPQGFLRKLRFMLQPAYYYRELTSKLDIPSFIEEMEDAGIEVLDKEGLGATKFKMLQPGRLGVMRRLEQESRKSVIGAVVPQIEFFFATIDRFPRVVTDNVKIGSKEGTLLKRKGFQEGAPFWYLPIRRSSLLGLLKDIQDKYPDVKIAEWDDFQRRTKDTFGVDLKDFDSLEG